METVIMHPDSKEQLSALKAFAKALKVKFETAESPYNPDFVAKIKDSTNQVKDGKFTTIDPSKSIWENLE
jgi:hypothetical protein